MVSSGLSFNNAKVTIELEDGVKFCDTALQLSLNISHDVYDVTQFGDTWRHMIQGVKRTDLTASLSDFKAIECKMSSIRSDKTERLLRMIDG